MADKQISQLVAATTINNDDLFVMQQGGTAKKLSGQKLSDFVYQSAADQIERVNEAVEQTQAAVDSLEEQKNEIAQTIADMAELGTDTTLTTPGMAADAAATGVVKDIALARFEQTEITGVPIATFDDGADNVPVKKLVVDIAPVQSGSGDPSPDNVRPITGWTGANVTRTGKNLCGKEALRNEFLKINGATDNPTDRYVSFSATAASKSILTKMYKENTRYTFIFTILKTTGTGSNLRIYYTDGTFTNISGASGIETKTTSVTTSSSGKTVRAIVNINSSGGTKIYYDESGVFEGVLTADDFEPYLGNTYDITFPTEAGTVYGGTLDVTNGVLTVDRQTLSTAGLKNLSWQNNTISSMDCVKTLVPYIKNSNKSDLVCSHFAFGGIGTSSVDNRVVNSINNYYNLTFVATELFTTVTEFNDYLDAQELAGTPVQLMMFMKPVVYQLTSTEVRTLLALNNIWANTGNINELIYRKMPTSTEEIYNTLETMIAGVEETMEATQNYTVDNFVVAAHKLYHISANIASGETLVPGTNCYASNVAAELSALVDNINSQFALLGNVATLTYQVVT